MATIDPLRIARLKQAAPTALLGIATGGIALVLSRIDPDEPGNPLPPCLFHALTGLYCPGCGSTRALHAVSHGDLAQAMAMNPLPVVTLPSLALMALNAAGWMTRGSAAPGRALAKPMPWLMVLVGVGVSRNLPWVAFAWLAPG